MNILELKLSLIEQVIHIDDKQLLNEIMDLINQYKSEEAEQLPTQIAVDKHPLSEI